MTNILLNTAINQQPAIAYSSAQHVSQSLVSSSSQDDILSRKKKLVYEALRIETISAEALEYFQRVQEILELGVNVPLPDYFHASPSWKEIIHSRKIEMRPEKTLDAFRGRMGVFISKINEDFYGNVAFAVDEGCLTDSEGYFFHTKGIILPEERAHSLWVCVLQDIPIYQETIAFIIAHGDEAVELKKMFKNRPDIVISPELGKEITQIFETVIQRPQKSSVKWKPMTKYGEIPLDESSKRFHQWWDPIV